MCTDRDQVRGRFERYLASGATGHPVVLAEVSDTVVVDPRPEPPRPFPLHQAFTFRQDRVVSSRTTRTGPLLSPTSVSDRKRNETSEGH
jgi:hypothetical protein